MENGTSRVFMDDQRAAEQVRGLAAEDGSITWFQDLEAAFWAVGAEEQPYWLRFKLAALKSLAEEWITKIDEDLRATQTLAPTAAETLASVAAADADYRERIVREE